MTQLLLYIKYEYTTLSIYYIFALFVMFFSGNRTERCRAVYSRHSSRALIQVVAHAFKRVSSRFEILLVLAEVSQIEKGRPGANVLLYSQK